MTNPADSLEDIRTFLREEAAGVANTADQLDETFLAVVRLLADTTGKVFVTGSGTSGFIARRMAHLLSVCGTPAVFLQPMDALHGSMGAISGGDVLIAISRGGGSGEITDLTARAKDRGATTIAITATAGSPFTTVADIVVVLQSPDGAEPGGVIAMGSTLVMAAWGDALALTLMRLRGYTWAEVLHTHPAGAVGQIQQAPAELPPLAMP